MKAIIIGTPGKGKTTLSNKLKELDDTIKVVSLCSLRSSLGIHNPYKNYETEVSSYDKIFLNQVVDLSISFYDNIIVEGYGLNPNDALYLGNKYFCPVVMLCHRNTNSDEDVVLVRRYDDKEKWTNFRTDEYLKNLFKFYKKVENKWIDIMPDEYLFDTSGDFDKAIQDAYDYIISHQNK